MLKLIAENLWVRDEKFSLPKGLLPIGIPGFLGQCRVRMTIVRMNNGEILIHSPIAPDDALVSSINALGKVGFIIGPCVMHNTYLMAWKNIYPEAKLCVAPSTNKRVPDIKNYIELNDRTPVSSADFKQKLMVGHKSRETLFLHVASKTLIATDLIYNIQRNSDFLERVYYRLFDAYGRPSICKYHQKFLRDENSFWAALDEVSEWDFDRVIMSHGEIIDINGREQFIDTWKSFRAKYF